MRIYSDVTKLLGNTPLVRINKLTRGLDVKVYAKMECFNPLSSAKDRIGVSMIEDAVITNSKKLYEELKFHQNTVGAVPGPFDCFLVLRGIKTLSLRMGGYCENAMKIADLKKINALKFKISL